MCAADHRHNRRSSVRKAVPLVLLALLAIGVASGRRWPVAATSAPPPPDVAGYSYYSRNFSDLVAESYRVSTGKEEHDFYGWMEHAYRASGVGLADPKGAGLREALEAQRRELAAIASSPRKAKAEERAAARAHAVVKAVIPRFSLERGYEFHSVVTRGERQCFLQSVLIAGLLQEMGVDAGVVMVYRNARGEASNNGHAVTLVRLADGRHILVDASEHEPFARHQGLLVMSPGYRYVAPAYARDSHSILRYRAAASGAEIAAGKVQPLGLDFVRSQFWYYRGERTEGGPLSSPPTAAGLETARRSLTTSVELCPSNALAVYMLGRVYLAQGRTQKARDLLERAFGLYSQAGWLPEGPKQYLALAKRGEGKPAQ